MAAEIPSDIIKDLVRACGLHERAAADYEQCIAFSSLMSDILARLEDAECWDMADKVMSVLLDCNPKTGAHCDKSTMVAQAMNKIQKRVEGCTVKNM